MIRNRGQLKREIIYEEIVRLDLPFGELGFKRLREVLSELNDKAAAAVRRAGFDLDDSIVDRLVTVQTTDGDEVNVPISIVCACESPKDNSKELLGAIRESERPYAQIIGARVTANREWLAE